MEQGISRTSAIKKNMILVVVDDAAVVEPITDTQHEFRDWQSPFSPQLCQGIGVPDYFEHGGKRESSA